MPDVRIENRGGRRGWPGPTWRQRHLAFLRGLLFYAVTGNLRRAVPYHMR
jgi:hypothetical protein